ncbi:hypothetical protein [Escherichia phage vB_EcoM_EP57]|nr:hypothetical protein [Escherichia phage vB_EcoM_EP57]
MHDNLLSSLAIFHGNHQSPTSYDQSQGITIELS